MHRSGRSAALNLRNHFGGHSVMVAVRPQNKTTRMSYDIGLYDKTFLRKAIDEDLGDYTVAPPLSLAVLASIKDRLLSLGYTIESDSVNCTEFIHPNDSWALQISVFQTEIAFSVPYWDDSENAIAQAKLHARLLAQEFNLGLTDQQDGETIY
jgi:hypothetical protein